MNKSIFKSKTFWTQVVVLISMVFPIVRQTVVDHPQLFTTIWAAVNVVLRFVTKERVVLTNSDDSEGDSNFIG